MAQNTFKINNSVGLKSKAARQSVPFASFIPNGLQMWRTHFWVNIRHFTKDYSLPLVVTVIVLLLLSTALLARISERATLASLLLGAPSSGQDYGTLLSQDKVNGPTRSDTTDPVAPSASANNTSSSNNSGNASSTPTTTTPGSTPLSGGTAPVPFSAAIAYLRQDNVTLECSSTKIKIGVCSKKYTYGAAIRTQGGPGLVNYNWRSSLTSANEAASYNASSGTVTTALSKQITIACTNPGTYTLQLLVTSPTQNQSETANIVHSCSDI
jgi:hypothetical protein